MSKVRIVMNRSGMNELLHSAGIESALMSAANAVQGRAGNDYAVSTPIRMPSRSIVRVGATNYHGVKDNLDNNTLLKSLHGG